MITIEGLGGKGTVWCAVRFGAGANSGNAKAEAYVPDFNSILSAPPVAMLLPPVGPAAIWYPCSSSAYGPRLDRFEVGTLFGVTTSPTTPNPCMHSTMTGGLLLAKADPLGSLHWHRFLQQSLSGKTFYDVSTSGYGTKVQFMQGMPSVSNAQGKFAYNRFGELVQTTGNYFASDVYAMLTDWCQSVGSSNPLFTNGVKQSQWITTALDTTIVPKMSALSLQKVECRHVSARVWIETKWFEYHQDNSYIKAEPVSKDTGYGYIVALCKRTRTITMTHIQSTATTYFKGRYSCEEEISFSTRSNGNDKPLVEGITTARYTFEAVIPTLWPGLVVGGAFLKEPLDAYCAQAVPRATLLYQSKNAKIARSDALADVTGLESNWIENLSQVKGTADVIKPIMLAYRAVTTGNLALGKRAFIDAYLSYKYVVAPGLRDYHDIKDNIGNVTQRVTTNRLLSERRRGKLLTKANVCDVVADLAYYCELNLRLKDNPVAAILNALESLGLNPSAANLWDLIPFSFVVDWFLPIGSVLSRLSAYENNALLRDVLSRIETFKVLWPLTEEELVGMIGHSCSITSPIKYSWYDRRILTTLGSYDPFAGQSLDGLTVSQMTQGGALLSSYKRR